MGHSAPIWIRYIKNYQAKIRPLLGMIPLTSATQKQRQSSTKITNASEKPWLPRRWKAQDLREDHDPNHDPSQHKATADLTWRSLVASYASVTNLGETPGPDASFQPVPEVVPTCSNQDFQHHLVGGWPTPRKIWKSQYNYGKIKHVPNHQPAILQNKTSLISLRVSCLSACHPVSGRCCGRASSGYGGGSRLKTSNIGWLPKKQLNSYNSYVTWYVWQFWDDFSQSNSHHSGDFSILCFKYMEVYESESIPLKSSVENNDFPRQKPSTLG